ncbi:MAG: hypothetical protein HY308_04590 [Gammaproteobacteria bacterium]|nr:hypothetical protein [Gammaproteobacteria bacterium]
MDAKNCVARLAICAFALTLISFCRTVDAADANGYSAAYECRAGGPQCNVDVATYTARACDQILTPSTGPIYNWSALSPDRDVNGDGFVVICLQPGDYTARGPLTFGGSNGASTNRKVLRCAKTDGTACDDPWRVTSADRARLKRIIVQAKNYWILHRLAVDGGGISDSAVAFRDQSSNNIVSRMLVENAGSGSWGLIDFSAWVGSMTRANTGIGNTEVVPQFKTSR